MSHDPRAILGLLERERPEVVIDLYSAIAGIVGVYLGHGISPARARAVLRELALADDLWKRFENIRSLAGATLNECPGCGALGLTSPGPCPLCGKERGKT